MTGALPTVKVPTDYLIQVHASGAEDRATLRYPTLHEALRAFDILIGGQLAGEDTDRVEGWVNLIAVLDRGDATVPRVLLRQERWERD